MDVFVESVKVITIQLSLDEAKEFYRWMDSISAEMFAPGNVPYQTALTIHGELNTALS